MWQLGGGEREKALARGGNRSEAEATVGWVAIVTGQDRRTAN